MKFFDKIANLAFTPDTNTNNNITKDVVIDKVVNKNEVIKNNSPLPNNSIEEESIKLDEKSITELSEDIKNEIFKNDEVINKFNTQLSILKTYLKDSDAFTATIKSLESLGISKDILLKAINDALKIKLDNCTKKHDKMIEIKNNEITKLTELKENKKTEINKLKESIENLKKEVEELDTKINTSDSIVKIYYHNFQEAVKGIEDELSLIKSRLVI